jgi:hypothetical protein
LALACFFISLLPAGPQPARANDPSLTLKFSELALENKLATESDLYFRLSANERKLAVRVRGLTLKEVSLEQVSQLVFQPFLGKTEPLPLPAPAIWTIAEGPGDTDRETIAPTELRPYTDEETETPEPPKRSTPTPTPTPKTSDEPERPSRYRVKLDNGWQLLLTPHPPRSDLLSRFWASVVDGWKRARGEQPAHPPLVVLVLDAEEARSLHHLFRSGRKILLVSP